MKHTKGPWYIRGIDGAHAQIAGNKGETVAKVWLHDENTGPLFSEANARLIAAAPDLHEAAVVALFVLAHITPVKTHEGTEGEDALNKAIDLLTAALSKVE